MANENPSLTKATYDKERPRKIRRSSAQEQAELDEKKRDAAKVKHAHQITPDALLQELGLPSHPTPKRAWLRR
jgi:uncharacterized protein (UPF0147 family)